MTEVKAMPLPGPSHAAVEFHYTQSDSFVALLHQLQASLLVTTYQANKLLVVRAAGAGLSTLVRTFDQPMGLTADARRLTIGTRTQVWELRNAPDIAARVEPAGAHDACFLPRSCHVTGDIRVHELAWVSDELWAVTTRFSCLCTLHQDSSFVPRWRPPFITALLAEDRCPLNGLALVAGQLKYVTALGATDTPDGWRPGAHGGCDRCRRRSGPIAWSGCRTRRAGTRVGSGARVGDRPARAGGRGHGEMAPWPRCSAARGRPWPSTPSSAVEIRTTGNDACRWRSGIRMKWGGGRPRGQRIGLLEFHR